jgi:hypothetical protein
MVTVDCPTLTRDYYSEDILISRLLIHLQKFRNIDLFSRGYAFRSIVLQLLKTDNDRRQEHARSARRLCLVYAISHC